MSTHRVPSRSARGIASILSIVLLGASVACGSGGSGEAAVIDASKSGSGLSAAFTPVLPSPGGQTVSTHQGSAAGDTVIVEVGVTGTDDVFGADFVLNYDPDRFGFVQWSAGDLLEVGGNTVQYLVFTGNPGTIEVGITVLGGAGVDVTGTTALIRLVFQARSAGNSSLSFLANAALLDQQAQSLPVQAWAGGTLVAN